ncbi:alpha/beta fold hydrolase [Mycobacterium sp.]|uniref:alpha/beta fold hydrolase n=1 Tax=Mycobacterium sp. TaxID=1785 RepID=UPI00333E7D8D|nr:hypothetical protein [Mycobacterium sp.]
MTTTDARKPTLLLVHGAWRGAWCWEDLEAELAESAWATQAVELSSALRLRRRTTIPRHARRRTGDPDRTHTHFGTSCRGGTFLWGIPVTQAIGSAANVIGVVYLAAFMLDVGECLLSVTDKSVPDDNAGVIAVTSDMRTAFYSDVADDQTSRAMSELMPQSHSSFAETVTRAGWREMPSAHAVCSNDHSFSPELQEQFATRAGTVERLASGHSLIFSMPAELARLLSRLALASAAAATTLKYRRTGEI